MRKEMTTIISTDGPTLQAKFERGNLDFSLSATLHREIIKKN